MIDDPNTQPAPAAPTQQSVRLPLSRPLITNVLLGVIVVVFVLQYLDPFVEYLGVQVNFLVGQGQYWRLLTAVFLHSRGQLTHILFNGWALYSLGREVESIVGSKRFTAIFFLTGLFGNLAYYLLGAPDVPSLGASGAIFGLVGADMAFFLRNRQVLGKLSRQQLSNLLVLVVINLVFGFTIPGINNMAHLGGLVSGFLLGLGLAPHYAVRWDGPSAETASSPTPRLVNRTSLYVQVVVVVLALLVFWGALRFVQPVWLAAGVGVPLVARFPIRT